VTGDRYGGDWPSEQFRKNNISYRPSEKTKSEIYQAALPMLNSGRVEILDHKVLRTQLLGLERRTARSGRDSIDHRLGGHDDIVNSAAGALIQCTPVIEMTADMFAQSGGRSAGSFATGYGGYHTETFMDWTRTRDGGRTLWDQMPEEKK
jgi:hypothetical protein